MTRVLVAPDKFKGIAPGGRRRAAVARGLRRVRPDADVECLPVADGGDGTLDAADLGRLRAGARHGGGPDRRAGGDGVRAARDAPRSSRWPTPAGSRGCPGARRAPLTASSRGLGEVIAAALDAGCRELVVGIGGSASTDGGAGLLAALGAVASPAPCPDGGAALAEVAAAGPGRAAPRARRRRGVVVACDVDNPLTGPDGAAAVYGPQKGATPTRWSRSTPRSGTGPTWSRARPARTAATSPVRGPRAASASPSWPRWAPSCARASS